MKKHLFDLEHLFELEHFKKHLVELEHLKKFFRVRTFQKSFDRTRTFTRTFDRGVVWRQNNDLKFCRRFFYYAAGKSGMCMNFSSVERKNDDEFFISVEKKKARRSRAII